MLDTLSHDAAQRGLFHFRADRQAQTPFQTRIWCRYGGQNVDLIDITPWGIIVPGEGVLAGLSFMVQVETLGMPAGSTLVLSWTPHDGSNPRTLDHTLSGDGQVSIDLKLPNDWLNEAIGKDVLIKFEVRLADGSVEIGNPLDIHISTPLGSGSMIVADLQDGDTLKPENYPDGLHVRIDPIAHIREYHTLAFDLKIEAVIAGGGLILLNHWEVRFSGIPGETYEFVVPPEAYTGFGDPSYQKLIAKAIPSVKLVPQPIPWFWFGLGGQTYDVLFSTRK